jgi:hypothetical protein
MAARNLPVNIDVLSNEVYYQQKVISFSSSNFQVESSDFSDDVFLTIRIPLDWDFPVSRPEFFFF